MNPKRLKKTLTQRGRANDMTKLMANVVIPAYPNSDVPIEKDVCTDGSSFARSTSGR